MQPSAISIVVPTFNRLQYLRPAIDSVFVQSWHDWELVIVDDGSDEETRAYLREVEQRPRVRVIGLPHTGIPAAVRNAGLAAATGEYVAFLDSDDLWAQQKLELQMAALRAAPGCAWCYTAFERVDRHGQVLAEERTRPWRPHRGWIFDQIVTGTASVRTPAVVAARALLSQVGGFDETLGFGEDYDLWMRLALRSAVAIVDEPLVQVRLHEHNHSVDWTGAFHARDRSLRKLEGIVDHVQRDLLRRERARNGARLLTEHAARDERRQVARVLIGSVPFSWRYLEWWRSALRAAARPYLPNRPRP